MNKLEQLPNEEINGKFNTVLEAKYFVALLFLNEK